MQLKKLEMIGFKSFANKTEILFEPGVTCIVGPNGCGKSNVVDAIKWVLGTLSYKSVRGEEMMDVIFKGAEGVGAAGYAEVSLTLDNSDHTLPLAFEEVTITRRLHRDGVGEYLINRSACRLKDIRDLLYGTGIGTDNYSIIEQGKIDRLVTSEPKQRRLVFDEAAGISKYRARKKETELRLEKVTQDLLRIGDMTKEIQRQLRSVRSQASRASAYKRLQEEYREKRTRLVHRDFRKLTETLAATDARIAGIDAEKAAREAALATARQEAATIDAELASLDDRHAALRQELAAADSKREFLDRTIEALKARQEELNRDRAAAETLRDDAIRRLQGVRDLAAQAEQERAGLETEASALETRITELKGRVEEAGRECRRIDQEIEAKKAERIELAARETEYRNQRTLADRERQACLARAERIAVRVADLDATLVQLRAELEASTGTRAALESEIADLKRRADLEEISHEQLKGELTRLDEELVALRAAKDMRTSRQATLRELEMSYEGLGEGTRALLKSGLPGVRGTLADLVEVNLGDVPALEAFLGDLAGMVIVDTREQAAIAIEYARVHGRASVISLEGAAVRPEAWIEEALDGIPRGDSLVTCDETVKALVKAVLGDVLVVDGPTEAQQLLANWPIRSVVVTRTGEAFDPRGLVSAGSRAGGPGLISRRSELKKLESEIEQFLNLITQRETRRSEALLQIREAELRLKGIRQASYEKRVEHGDLVHAIEQSGQKVKVGQAELDAARAEACQLEIQQLQYMESVARADGLIAGLDGLRAQLDADVETLAATQKTYETTRGELQEELTRIQVERGSFDEKRRGIEARIDMYRKDQAEQEETVRGTEARLADFEARRGSVEQELGRHVADRETLARDAEERRKAAEAIDTERQAVVARTEEARRKISSFESEASAAQVEGSQLAVQQAQQRMSVQQIVEKSRDELNVDLTVEAPAAEEGVDWETLTRESEDIRSRISNFGAVNVVALEELNQLEIREKEIIGQHEDLERTKGQLEELIRRINRESKELFERTLEFVREQFSTIFRKVFGGGKADIILQAEEGVEPLDQGLEVVVRMPQRESLPISMLSGGQKSLTAFSLVMALFKANPSPFCILDEADAALDEKNVDKYSGIITEYVEETQFIVISHNKRTMAVADVLYGVTMETPGVSKKVSVDLHGNNLDVLREKRETLKTKRAEVTARKAAAMTEVKEAAAKALEAEKATEAAAVAIAEPPAPVEAPPEPPADPISQ